MANLIMIFDNFGESQSLTLNLGIFSSPTAAENYRKRIQSNNTTITTILEVFPIR
ncbi:hypothetical protein [Bacteroides finegoldii]|uniref:hypothetical protein n=1 Tax=Bacteroides finegoldii TaxID=338188 RepID=UPI0032EDA052